MTIDQLKALAARLPDANLINNNEQGYQITDITIDGHKFHARREIAAFNNPELPSVTSVKSWHHFWVYSGSIEINALPPQDRP